MNRLGQDQDAFGWEIFDHHRGLPAVEICERDDGYINTSSGPSAYFKPHLEWPPYEQEAIKLARGPVLDVGCGAGRVSLHLQSQGMEVLGIDNSPLALKVCRLRGVKRTKLIEFHKITPALGCFRTVVMFGNNFGLFGSLARARRLLRRLHTMTTLDARIIASTLDPYQTEDPAHLAYHRLNRARGRMTGQIRLRIRHKTSVTPWFDYLFVSKKELVGLLDGTGWRLTGCIDARGGSYIAVIERG